MVYHFYHSQMLLVRVRYLATPIQLANMAAAIGNRGYYYTPHIIKKIEGETVPSKFTDAANTPALAKSTISNL